MFPYTSDRERLGIILVIAIARVILAFSAMGLDQVRLGKRCFDLVAQLREDDGE